MLGEAMARAGLGNPFDAGCDGDLVDMSAFGIVVGSFLCVASGLAMIPSLTKPIKMKSTMGVSPATLILTNLQQTLGLANTLVLKWPQVQQCGAHPLGCQPTMIQLYTTAVSAIMLFPQHFLTVCYPNPPEAKCKNRVWWYGQVISCGAIIVGSIWWSCVSKCSEDNALRLFGVWCGLISSVLMVLRFVPQVYITVRTRSSGSISLITYGCIGLGGFVFTYFSIAQSHEEVTTWLPVFVGNCFQTFILILCIFYDYILPRRQAASTETDQEAQEVSFLLVRSATGGVEKVRSWAHDVRASNTHVSALRRSRTSGSSPLRPVAVETANGEIFDASGGYIVPPAAALDEYIGDVLRSWATSSMGGRRSSMARGVSTGTPPQNAARYSDAARVSWQTYPSERTENGTQKDSTSKPSEITDDNKDRTDALTWHIDSTDKPEEKKEPFLPSNGD